VALTLGPALIAALGMLLVGFSPRLLRSLGQRGASADPGRWLGRARVVLRSGLGAAADGVEEAIALLRAHSFGVVVGSFAYMAFDIAALGFGFAAIGPAPAFGVLVLGYLIGQLGGNLPLPAGLGGIEGGLVGTFALYHQPVAGATAAVLVYHAISLWMPALLGSAALVKLRKTLAREHRPYTGCAPAPVRPAVHRGRSYARSGGDRARLRSGTG
jgi:uncharacterized membrane protein YbhN (UPF0104 family)